MRGVLWLGLAAFLFALQGAATEAPQRVRAAAVAGTWYPDDAGELATYLDGLLDAAKAPGPDGGRVLALIAPHAGYRFSGATAADAYRQVRGRSYKRVLVLGPTHRAWFEGLSLADVDRYETPLGRIPLDLEAVQALRRSDLVQSDSGAHRREHSIEMQLPLLQRALAPGWKLVPVLVGSLEGEQVQAAAELLKPLMDGDTLVVVSSDFTHYGPNYRYLPFPLDDETPAHIEKLDRGALDRILKKDADGLVAYQHDTGITICGFRPIAVLLAMLPGAARGKLLSYTTSGELTGDFRNSVSYMAVTFRDPPAAGEPASGLSQQDLRRLHGLASRAVEVAVRPFDADSQARLAQEIEAMPAQMQQPSGAFVTLKKQGRLRGCIGYIQPINPLAEAVAENGFNAALRDPRFRPVEPDELDGLELEVSVLTPPRPIDSYREFRVGEQGIILEKSGRRAVFLPEVATEQGWDRTQTLTHLARKAGLPGDAWEEGAHFEVFDSQKYSAPLNPANP